VFIGVFTLFVINQINNFRRNGYIEKISEVTKNTATYEKLYNQMVDISEKYKKNSDILDGGLSTLAEVLKQYETDKKNTNKTLEKLNSLQERLFELIKDLEQTRTNYENLNGINNIIEPINDIHSKVTETGNYINNINKSTKELSEKNVKDIDYIKKIQKDIVDHSQKVTNIKKNNTKQLNEIRDKILNSEESGKTKNLKFLLDLIDKIYEELGMDKNKINYNI
jgi:DNA repair exonuclease SbcCD ATPase subunit